MKLKVLVLIIITMMVSGCCILVPDLIEATTKEMRSAIEETRELEKPKVAETKVEELVDNSAEWEKNRMESTERYAIWDKWRDQNYEYQFNDQELKIRLSTEFRSDFPDLRLDQSLPEKGEQWTQSSQFEIMIQNKTDRPFTLSVNEQEFIFLIDGMEKTYGSTKNLEYDDPIQPWNRVVNERPDGFQFQLEPFGTYDETGMHRKDLVILFFRASQMISLASMDNIYKDDKDILAEEIIPIKVDDVKGGPGFVTIRLNDKSYKIYARDGWSGLPFLEDVELHKEIKLDPQIITIANMPDYFNSIWRGRGMVWGQGGEVYALSQLRRDFLGGKDYATLVSQ